MGDFRPEAGAADAFFELDLAADVAGGDDLRVRRGEVRHLAVEHRHRGSVAGQVVTIDRELPLAEAAEAQRLLEARATTGKVLLLPPA